MARPLTKGPTIQVQLPLELDAQIRAEAEQAQTSPGLYLADEIVQGRAKRATKTSPCAHRQSTAVGTAGVRECSTCHERFIPKAAS